MHVLEALLRLRQAACHPGLIDPKRVDEPSAKLDVLMEQLARDPRRGPQGAGLFAIHQPAGHRAPAPGPARTCATNISTARPRNRQAHVETFQNDPECGLFLISLKAGGLGLNLTAAEYVFLLDPWWNPAVEAQAIDRAHRIGQTRPVFAYRLIARDTVEEKVLQLQKTKRDLARRDPQRGQQLDPGSEEGRFGVAAFVRQPPPLQLKPVPSHAGSPGLGTKEFSPLREEPCAPQAIRRGIGPTSGPGSAYSFRITRFVRVAYSSTRRSSPESSRWLPVASLRREAQAR